MKKIVSKLWINCFNHDCEKYVHCIFVDWENRAFFVESPEEKENLWFYDNFLYEDAENLILLTNEVEDNEEQ